MLCGWQHLTGEQRAQIATGIAENRVLGGPYMLEIHPTNRCTVQCFFCYCADCRHGETLPWDALERLLREGAAGDVRYLRLSGGGESLLYPQIHELLDLIGELGLRIVDLTTNATRLEETADKLVGVGLDYAMISLNEAEPERYGRMMQVAPKVFDKAIRGVEALVRARDAAPPERRTRVELQFMVWRENYMHLKQMAALGRALGADQVVLKGAKQLPPEQRIPAAAYAEVKAQVSELIAEDCASGHPVLNFDLSAEPELNQHAWEERRRHPSAAADAPDFAIRPLRTHYCYMGWLSALVSASGLVYPCCPFYGLPGKDVGNIHEASLQAIWTGARYQRFRSEIQQLRHVRGGLEHSRRLHQFIEPVCIQEYGCLFGYNLCDEPFYEAAARRAEAETPLARRLAARLGNAALRQAHRLTGWWRR